MMARNLARRVWDRIMPRQFARPATNDDSSYDSNRTFPQNSTGLDVISHATVAELIQSRHLAPCYVGTDNAGKV
jgi:hypothetical protein